VDTREKITLLEDLPRRMGAGEWLAVVGLFDPLTATQAARVAEIGKAGRGLLAIVLDDPDTLLAADARAALMAGLRDVRLVCVAKAGEWGAALGSLGVKIFEDAGAERARSAEFVEFVLERQSRE
jgi:hypothetical protein